MAVFDSRTTQGQADDTLHQALVEAFEEYFTQAQEAILGPGAVTADATPGDPPSLGAWPGMGLWDDLVAETVRSEEHTSELQSRGHRVCRLLLEKKNQKTYQPDRYIYLVVYRWSISLFFPVSMHLCFLVSHEILKKPF